MRFYEFEAKELFGRYGIPLPRGFQVAKNPAEAVEITRDIGGPVVLKSQVLSGGRMKAGGVLFAETSEEAARQTKKILGIEINGHRPIGVLVEARAPIAQEYYMGVTWDGVR
ncbi:MAG: ATP-grasp domain-containing protein, partial [Myxococcota bacterium]